MEKMSIQDKLRQLGVYVEDISLGDFDLIGEYTAKKSRSNDKKLYKEVGCFFRPNYERGILIYYLTRKKEFESILEIGFGRGYSTLCAAKAMCDHGIEGKITTVDPNIDEAFLKHLYKIFPNQWFEKIEFVKKTSDDFFLENKAPFDLVYIDGDHRYETVKNDWNNSKKIFKKFVLFDDYHLPTKKQKDIECAAVIDDIQEEEFDKELIIMDRRIFFDDRGIKDKDMDYGQVLVNKKG